MRSDLILPVLLATALVAMVTYAITGEADNSGTLEAAALPCQDASNVHTLAELPEASGLAISRRTPELLWAHNDSAGPVLYGIGSDGAVRARVRLAGAAVTDWEAVTAAACNGDSCLYIGDIGDNDRARRSITVYRAIEPTPDRAVSHEASAIEGVYPEGAQDAEAMFVAGGALHIVTKGEGSPIRIYRFPSLENGRRHTLQLVASLTDGPVDKPVRITDAATSPDERWIALRTNTQILVYDRAALLSGQPGTPYAIDVRALGEPQGEGLAWADAHTLYVAGEGEGGGTFAKVTCPGIG